MMNVLLGRLLCSGHAEMKLALRQAVCASVWSCWHLGTQVLPAFGTELMMRGSRLTHYGLKAHASANRTHALEQPELAPGLTCNMSAPATAERGRAALTAC